MKGLAEGIPGYSYIQERLSSAHQFQGKGSNETGRSDIARNGRPGGPHCERTGCLEAGKGGNKDPDSRVKGKAGDW